MSTVGSTLLILTDAESRLIRRVLEGDESAVGLLWSASEAFNRGIKRGTERLAEEFKERTKK